MIQDDSHDLKGKNSEKDRKFEQFNALWILKAVFLFTLKGTLTPWSTLPQDWANDFTIIKNQ